MENPIIDDGHKETVRKAKEYYKKIGRVWSPALGDYVNFNNVGFTHLLRKRGIPRIKSEQKRRLILLAEAAEIIADPRVVPKYQKKEIPVSAGFWKLTREKNGQTTHVVIRQLESGSKHFFSVYANE